MKAAEFIKIVRDDIKELTELHQLCISSEGKFGLRCLNPDELERKMKRTDREILEEYLACGAQIDDAEEYLAKIGE